MTSSMTSPTRVVSFPIKADRIKSDLVTMPATSPFSTTGTPLISFPIIRDETSLMLAPGPIVAGFGVISTETGMESIGRRLQIGSVWRSR